MDSQIVHLTTPSCRQLDRSWHQAAPKSMNAEDTKGWRTAKKLRDEVYCDDEQVAVNVSASARALEVHGPVSGPMTTISYPPKTTTESHL